MLLNYETIIVGRRVVLVPYRPQHVAKYHEWMQQPYLLEATASEPLSMEQEYDMQESWRHDRNKCTFIVLDQSLVAGLSSIADNGEDSSSSHLLSVSDDFIDKNLPAMVGDVNLFLSEEEMEDDDDVETNNIPNSRNQQQHLQAEIDIMIAEPYARAKGFGKEAASLMMLYAAERLHIRRFFCKINQDNVASLRLFQASLGFVQCNFAECFREVELELKCQTTAEIIQRLSAHLRNGSSGEKVAIDHENTKEKSYSLTTLHCPLDVKSSEYHKSSARWYVQPTGTKKTKEYVNHGWSWVANV